MRDENPSPGLPRTHKRLWEQGRSQLVCRFTALCGVLALASLGRAAEAGISYEGDLTVFRSSTNSSFLTLELPYVAPSADQRPRLLFEFGFSTEQRLLPITFLDSFSVTLQGTEASSSALLLTADAFGVAWAPPNPGGLPLDDSGLSYTNIPFASVDPILPWRFAFAVSYLLPPQLCDGPLSLFLDFLDTSSPLRSLAYVTRLLLQTSPGTNREPSYVVLESSTSPSGPYQEEPGAKLDLPNRTITAPETAPIYFFRLSSDLESMIAQFQVLPDRFEMVYGTRPAGLKVLASPRVEGPYSEVLDAQFDAAEQAMSVRADKDAEYFVLESTPPVQISGAKLLNDRLLLPFEAPPARLSLLSSPTARGPYTGESAAQVDPTLRTIRLPRSGSQRYFRLRSDIALRITRIERQGGLYLLYF